MTLKNSIPYLIMFSIFTLAFEKSLFIRDFNISHMIVIFITFCFFPYIINFILLNKAYLVFIGYIFIHAIITAISADSDQVSIIIARRFFLFFCCFSVMILMINFFSTREQIQKLDSFITHIIIITTIFGMYQLIARQFGFPLGVLGEQKFREYGYITQCTSFFNEPRFYSSFLITLLYIILFIKSFKNQGLLLSMLVTSSLLTVSVTSYTMIFILLSAYLLLPVFQTKESETEVTKDRFSNFFRVLLIVIMMFSLFQTHKIVTKRFRTGFSEGSGVKESLYLALTQNPSHLYYHDLNRGSIYVSTFSELGFFVKTLRECPLFGYGIGYDNYELERTMALNAFTEITVRWGLVGLFLFVYLFLWKSSKDIKAGRIVFVIFLILFCCGDGAIAKALFWFLIALLFIYKNYYLTDYHLKIEQADEMIDGT